MIPRADPARFRAAATLLTLLGACLRLWRIQALPPGLPFDEAHNAIDAARFLDGTRPLFLGDNGGREILLTWLQAPMLAALGRDHAPLALAVVSALVGTATIPLVAVVMARLLRNRAAGLLAAGFLATSLWHVHFSRFGIRAILAPFWTSAAVLTWWRATRPGVARLRADGWATACGALLAAAVYSHPTGRLLPLIPAGHAAARMLAARRQPRDRARGEAGALVRALALAAAVALALFAPLGAHFVRHPWHFTSHAADVSLAAVAARDHGGRLAAALAANAAAIAGMLAVRGDASTFHNLPGLPVFDPLAALAAMLGAGALLGLALRTGPRREAAGLLLLWLAVMLVPTLLSDRPPNYSRAIAALPVIALLPALGLALAAAAAGLDRRRRGALAALALAVAGAWTARHYFHDYPRLDALYTTYDLDKLDAVAFIQAQGQGAQVFLAPLWATHATVAYLVEHGPLGAAPPFRALDARDTLVLPAGGRDVIVAFPAAESRQRKYAARSAALLGPAAPPVQVALGARGLPLLEWLRVPASAIGDMLPPTDAPLEPAVWTALRFGQTIELVGVTVGVPTPGEQMAVTPVWRAHAPIDRDLTLFVQLRGPAGEPWGQEDREPGRASYPTTRWRTGDTIVDRYTPELIAEATGAVTVCLGWYDGRTGERLSAAGVGDELCLAPVAIDPAPRAP